MACLLKFNEHVRRGFESRNINTIIRTDLLCHSIPDTERNCLCLAAGVTICEERARRMQANEREKELEFTATIIHLYDAMKSEEQIPLARLVSQINAMPEERRIHAITRVQQLLFGVTDKPPHEETTTGFFRVPITEEDGSSEEEDGVTF